VSAELPVAVHFSSGHVVDGTTIDISMGGAAIELPAELPVGDATVTDIVLAMGDDRLAVPVETSAGPWPRHLSAIAA
jgi:cellulose synthase (UDP-forming)